jgi:hypothetical protein
MALALPLMSAKLDGRQLQILFTRHQAASPESRARRMSMELDIIELVMWLWTCAETVIWGS